MHLRYVVHHHARRLARRYPALRRIAATPCVLALLWLCVLYWGERATFTSHVRACRWPDWEQWPAAATPHRLVFIADPQLVDPHTYPGRPWPLSSLTEAYTDRYMARSFRLINLDLDPDSIVFLGDLFDGGREWATQRARPLKAHQRKKLEAMGILPVEQKDTAKKDGDGTSEESEQKTGKSKRSIESYKKALSVPHDHVINKKDHFLDDRGNDLKEFVHGENGRWSKWGQRQWEADLVRFARIFFDPKQLYPRGDREVFAVRDVLSDPIAVANGAKNITRQEYATAGGKPRRVIASLPGNHDLGFGFGVQLAVRERFQLHFGDANRVDVIGNHTFVSLDTPSLSAVGQFMPEGGETQPDRVEELKHVWEPTVNFMENIQQPARKAVVDALHRYYPDQHEMHPGYPHAVTDLNAEPAVGKTARASSELQPHLPAILLSHVPLYRNPDTYCGPLRESRNAITVSAGYQYQNVITRTLSNDIVHNVSSVGELMHIFSGDDHDYCDITHRYNVGPANSDSGGRNSALRLVKEITVKSLSWAMGVKRPGFLLVSLWNPVDASGETIGTPLPTIQTHLCLLPNQLGILLDYGLLAGFTLAVLLVRAVVIGLRSPHQPDVELNGDVTPTKLALPIAQANGAANGSYTKVWRNEKGRQRASSTSTSTNHNNNAPVGVQRSYNARTRTVSPARGYTAGGGYGLPRPSEPTASLIEKAGYFPQVRWSDPADESDEEKNIGVGADSQPEPEDSQAKWRRRRRAPTKVQVALEELTRGLAFVGLPNAVFYLWLIRHG